MSMLSFYREQAATQQAAADAASLENVRDRCQRAADAWEVLAARCETAETARLEAASHKLLAGSNENPDRGTAAA